MNVQIAKDQTGAYHLLVDGSLKGEPLKSHDEAMEAVKTFRRANPGSKFSAGVVRMNVQKATGFSVLEGSIGDLAKALETGDFDKLLTQVLEAETAGQNRKGALAAIKARAAVL